MSENVVIINIYLKLLQEGFTVKNLLIAYSQNVGQDILQFYNLELLKYF